MRFIVVLLLNILSCTLNTDKKQNKHFKGTKINTLDGYKGGFKVSIKPYSDAKDLSQYKITGILTKGKGILYAADSKDTFNAKLMYNKPIQINSLYLANKEKENFKNNKTFYLEIVIKDEVNEYIYEENMKQFVLVKDLGVMKKYIKDFKDPRLSKTNEISLCLLVFNDNKEIYRENISLIL